MCSLKRFAGTACVALLGLVAMPRSAAADDAPGKSVFLAHNCQSCHGVSAEGIKGEGDAPDLSKVGAKHDAATLEKYVTKQIELAGKKHKKKFQGSDDELKKLVAWLAALK